MHDNLYIDDDPYATLIHVVGVTLRTKSGRLLTIAASCNCAFKNRNQTTRLHILAVRRQYAFGRSGRRHGKAAESGMNLRDTRAYTTDQQRQFTGDFGGS